MTERPEVAESTEITTDEPVAVAADDEPDPALTERLAKLVAAAARVPTHAEDLTAETSLLDDLDIDSILLVELIVNIELEFDIELQDEDTEINRMILFGSLLRTIAHRVAEAQTHLRQERA